MVFFRVRLALVKSSSDSASGEAAWPSSVCRMISTTSCRTGGEGAQTSQNSSCLPQRRGAIVCRVICTMPCITTVRGLE